MLQQCVFVAMVMSLLLHAHQIERTSLSPWPFHKFLRQGFSTRGPRIFLAYFPKKESEAYEITSQSVRLSVCPP
jgi:hypothetical protein